MKNTVVSVRYAEALFELAKDSNLIENVRDDLRLMTETLDAYHDFNKLLFHPVVNKDDKKEMLSRIFGGKISDVTSNFVKLLIDKNRESLIPEISEAFDNLVNKLHSKVIAKIYTAVSVTEKELDILRNKLEKYLEKKVDMETHVDETILGGVLVKIGDRIIDGTVKSRFENMARSLR